MFRLKSGTLESAGEIVKLYEGDKIFSASNRRLLVSGVRTKQMYAADLREHWDMPMGALCKLFPGTDVIGEGGPKGAKLFRLTTPPSPLRRGVGELYAASSDALVYGTGDAIRTEMPNGTAKGTVRLNLGTGYFNNIEIAGPERLYFSRPGEERITDLGGKTIVKVRPPDGWGFRHGWSSDGGRMAFDRYLPPPLLTRGLSWIVDAFGTVLPEQPHGEVVRVIEVLSGNTCFNLESVGVLFGAPGEYHTDLSPSGNLVAVTTLKEFSIYTLPTDCPGNSTEKK